MIRIYLGKSAAGKDYFYRKDIKENGYKPVVSYTTRPMRENEVNGKDYNFIGVFKFHILKFFGRIIESRSYKTLVNNKRATWYYGTPRIKNPKDNYVVVVDIEGAKALVKAFPDDCEVIYINADEDIRTKRAMNRGSFDETEWNRRLLDDEIKFSESQLKSLQSMCKSTIRVIDNN